MICRTCLKMKSPENCKDLSVIHGNNNNSNILEMLSFSIPELDMFLVLNPIICDSCIKLLEISFNFKMQCLKNEERLLKFSVNTNSRVNIINFYNNVNMDDDQEFSKVAEMPKISNHKETKNGNNSFPRFDCERCRGCSASDNNPSSHSKTNIMPFICFHCNKMWDNIGDLRKHMLKHVKQRKCKICDKFFRDLSQLRKHVRSHTGAKPFACTICPKKFQQKHSLTQHLQQHEGFAGLTCTFCNKSYSTKYNMLVHMKSHKRREICELCGESFTSKRDLVKHMETDTEVCGKIVKSEVVMEDIKPFIEEHHILLDSSLGSLNYENDDTKPILLKIENQFNCDE